MKNLVDFALKEKYEKVQKLRSNLEKMNELIDWEALFKLFPKTKNIIGRPAYDKIIMLKILFLQNCYGISDEEIEFQINDRLSFQQFLGFPKSIPDYSTIWRFREELTENDIAEKIWSEHQRQIQAQNIKLEKGVIQDARFIHADPGKKRSGMKDRGREAKTSRSRDGSWTKKNKKSYFGFKLHTKVQLKSKIITEIALTTAKTHDGSIDLAKPDEIIYRDKGYTGKNTKAKGNATMKRGKLSIWQKLRNKRISRKRCRGEHQYGVMHRCFNAGRTKLTTISRVYIQQIFICMNYNFNRVRFLAKAT